MLRNLLDTNQLRCEYEKKNRIFIKDILQRDAAISLTHSLAKEIPWQIGYMEKGIPHVFSAQNLANMSTEQWDLIQKGIIAQGSKGFQFCYGHYSVTDTNTQECQADAFINKFRDFLLSDQFFEFARAVTGIPEVCKLEILAARFLPGNFLMVHDDHAKPERKVAFVFSLARDWRVDWGGLTHFLEPDGAVSDTFVPTFNSLSMFNVPVPHAVSYIMPFAQQPRYTVTGWLTV